jgi:hypothetical protein
MSKWLLATPRPLDGMNEHRRRLVFRDTLDGDGGDRLGGDGLGRLPPMAGVVAMGGGGW